MCGLNNQPFSAPQRRMVQGRIRLRELSLYSRVFWVGDHTRCTAVDCHTQHCKLSFSLWPPALFSAVEKQNCVGEMPQVINSILFRQIIGDFVWMGNAERPYCADARSYTARPIKPVHLRNIVHTNKGAVRGSNALVPAPHHAAKMLAVVLIGMCIRQQPNS